MNGRDLFVRMLYKDSYWHVDNHTDIHMFYFYFILFTIFVIFTELNVSDAHNIRLISEHVCMYVYP